MLFKVLITDRLQMIYVDMANMFKRYAENMGCHVQFLKFDHQKCTLQNCCTQNLVNTDTVKHVFFGTHYRDHYIPPGSILTMFDCIDLYLPIFGTADKMKNDIEANLIVHYTADKLPLLRQLYPYGNFAAFNMGYCEENDFSLYVKQGPYEFDVCMLGNIEDRRRSILNELAASGLRVFSPDYTHLIGIQRAQLYRRSKVVLQIYNNEHTRDCSAESRIVPAVSTNCFTISELSSSSGVNDKVRHFTVLAPYETMVSTIKYYVEHDQEREELQERHYQYLRLLYPTISTDEPCKAELYSFLLE